MKYHIDTEGYRVASFTHKEDRDICIESLRDFWEDCIFIANEEE